MIASFVGSAFHQSRYRTRLQQAVAQESMKYSTRSPIPCSWRLITGKISGYAHGDDTTITNERVSHGISFW